MMQPGKNHIASKHITLAANGGTGTLKFSVTYKAAWFEVDRINAVALDPNKNPQSYKVFVTGARVRRTGGKGAPDLFMSGDPFPLELLTGTNNGLPGLFKGIEQFDLPLNVEIDLVNQHTEDLDVYAVLIGTILSPEERPVAPTVREM